MYLSSTSESLEVVLGNTITTNHLQWTVSYQEITSAGMTLPQSSNQGVTNNTTAVTMVAAPAASTNRQVVLINVYNSDTVAATVIIQEDVSGTNYVLVKALLQVGDTLMWSREAGWTINKQSTQESVIITEFTTTGTWTKPTGLKRVLVCCVGAGGGGGSGRKSTTAENRFGGGGGGGGAIVWRNVAASDLTSTVAVTLGTGGTGGAAQTVLATNGNPGTAGGDTSFGALVIAKGGGGGSGGTVANGNAGTQGSAQLSVPSYGPYAIAGSFGGSGASGSGSAGGGGMNSSGASGGGGGSGIVSGGTINTTGGTGGGVYQNGILIAGPTTSNPGVANQSRFLFFSSTLSSTNGLGTGGAGAGANTNLAGGAGGNYGAGGGGGGAGATVDSGAGGAGANGLCLVMEIY
jgi:hypothetical protein